MLATYVTNVVSNILNQSKQIYLLYTVYSYSMCVHMYMTQFRAIVYVNFDPIATMSQNLQSCHLARCR